MPWPMKVARNRDPGSPFASASHIGRQLACNHICKFVFLYLISDLEGFRGFFCAVLTKDYYSSTFVVQ